MDLSKGIIKKAADLAKTEMVSDRVVFEVGDAERLPFKTGAFDAIISECALCLFPTKKRALSETYRVLKEESKIALSDVTLDQTPKVLRSSLSFLSCVAGAKSQDALQSLFEDVGFVEITAIDASQVIVDLYESLKRQSFLLKPLLKIVVGSCGCVDLKNIEEFGRTVEQLILEGKLGYSVLMGKNHLALQ